MKAKFFLFMMLLSTLSLFAQTEKLFDPTKDPFEDWKVTVDEATKLNKRIILDVGGDWCVWCHRIDAFMHNTEEIESLLR
jgi:thiol:disulfide interchange protein